ncbi:hypothetical protein ILUMI_23608 [Ignelater luminosus]|uniref:Uncharacterized protein n=1 Tax=Ignelater luminosus TaxID=2038154 RepID=A0A8K0CBT1_IGNLU|nr:hypothetical protein ILUMI_23608 [Ignelater luminosus]
METRPVTLPLSRGREAAVYEVTGVDLCGPVLALSIIEELIAGRDEEISKAQLCTSSGVVTIRAFQRIHLLEVSTDDQITQNIENVSEPPPVEEEEAG